MGVNRSPEWDPEVGAGAESAKLGSHPSPALWSRDPEQIPQCHGCRTGSRAAASTATAKGLAHSRRLISAPKPSRG